MLGALLSVAMAEPPAYRRTTDTPLKKIWRTLHNASTGATPASLPSQSLDLWTLSPQGG
jgi:hypothetical protein